MSKGTVLFVRYISPNETYDNLKSGYFSDCTLENSPRFKIKLGRRTREVYDASSDESKFTIRVHGSVINVYTTGYTSEDDTPRCWFCRSDIPKKNIPLCIPTKLERKTYVIEGERKIVYSCSGETLNCDFNCTLGSILADRYGPKVEANIRLLNSIVNPDSEFLEPASDPKLLKINGGTMTYKEYKKTGSNKFHKIHGLILNRGRECFAQLGN